MNGKSGSHGKQHPSRILKLLFQKESKDYFPRALTTTRRITRTNSPTPDTAAAVSSPDMEEATVSPARTNIMMNSTRIPSGVLITEIIPVVPLDIRYTSQKDSWREPDQKKILFGVRWMISRSGFSSL